MKTTTEMQLVPIAKLVPYVNNARTHSPEQITKLRSSLREFGFINPVIIDRDFNVIAGHGRILAAKEEGITEVPCVFADHLSEAQKKAYIIADNRMAMDAGWDEELLRVEIESLQGMDFDPLLTGFDEKELAALFDDGMEAKEDDFDVDAELQKPAFSRLGDVWTLGRHRLVCGDSTKAETYTALMDGVKANLVITDPPYNVNYEGSAVKIKNDNMAGEKFYEFLLAAFKNLKASLREKRAFYIWYASSNHLQFEHAIIDAGLKSKQVLFWNKGMILGHSDYHWAAEPCFYGCHEGENSEWFGDRCQTTVWDIKRDNTREYVHPTQKPTALAIKAIFNSSKAGETVLDLFGGSGSTLIACEQTNRVNCTMEFDPKYVDVIRRRWAEFVHGEGCDWQALTPAVE